MSKPYDAGTKFLIEHYPSDWLALVDRAVTAPVEALDADLSTVTALADKLLLVKEPHPWILHLELQASRDSTLAERMHWYNALIGHRHECLVHSMAILLRREADEPGLTGEYWQQFAGAPPHCFFRFQVVRVWQLPMEQLLAGGLGLLPLAPLADEAKGAMAEVMARLSERIQQEIPDQETAGVLWTVTSVLMGMRYQPKEVLPYFSKGSAMKESTTYQAIVEEGEVKGIRETLLLLGGKKLGAPEKDISAALANITDIAKLRAMTERLLDVESWQELVGKQ